jgi:hypothetical protein
MVQFSIRCHSCVPVSPDELESWLEDQVDDIRADAPQAIIRMSRLTQGLPGGDCEIGWLIEVELPDADPPLGWNRVAGTLEEIRLLGLHPTLLMPHNLSSGAIRRGESTPVVGRPAARATEAAS